MYTLLIIMIYMAFISLGLPDSLLGSAWPVMYQTLNVPISYMGIVTMTISGGTIVSSLFSDFLTKKDSRKRYQNQIQRRNKSGFSGFVGM